MPLFIWLYPQFSSIYRMRGELGDFRPYDSVLSKPSEWRRILIVTDKLFQSVLREGIFFVNFKKKKEDLFLKLGTIFFQTWEEFLNVSIPNCNNKTEGIKLFFQRVTGYHLFHSGIHYYVIGIFYLYKQNTCFDIFFSVS